MLDVPFVSGNASGGADVEDVDVDAALVEVDDELDDVLLWKVVVIKVSPAVRGKISHEKGLSGERNLMHRARQAANLACFQMAV